MDLEELLNLRRKQLQEELVPKPLRRKIFRGVAASHVLLIFGPVALMIVLGWFSAAEPPQEAIITVEFVNPDANDSTVGGPVGEGGPPAREAYQFEDIPDVTTIPEERVKLETPDIPDVVKPEPKQNVNDDRAKALAEERERLEQIQAKKKKLKAEEAKKAREEATRKAKAKKAAEEKKRREKAELEKQQKKERERQEALAAKAAAEKAAAVKAAADKAAAAKAAADARKLLAGGTGVKNPTPNGGVGGRGVLGDAFDGKLKSFVNMHWKGLVPSRQQLNGRNPNAEIELSISANGRIVNATFSKPSGVPAMDDAVRSLIKRLVGATVPMSPGEEIKRVIELQIDR